MTSSTNKALIVVTSVAKFPPSAGEHAGRATGFYMDEMAGPYFALTDAGYAVTIASIAGGEPPIDPSSLGEEGDRKPTVQRFLDDADAMAKLKDTPAVSAIDPTNYAAVFLPGGHGTMWDFRQSADLARLVGSAWDNGAVVSAVCHGPAGLIEAVDANGEPIVKGRRVNSFTDAEEAAVGLTDAVPFLVETSLREQGARFEGTDNFGSHVAVDGRLVTGQNPASVAAVGGAIVAALASRRTTKAA